MEKIVCLIVTYLSLELSLNYAYRGKDTFGLLLWDEFWISHRTDAITPVAILMNNHVDCNPLVSFLEVKWKILNDMQGIYKITLGFVFFLIGKKWWEENDGVIFYTSHWHISSICSKTEDIFLHGIHMTCILFTICNLCFLPAAMNIVDFLQNSLPKRRNLECFFYIGINNFGRIGSIRIWIYIIVIFYFLQYFSWIRIKKWRFPSFLCTYVDQFFTKKIFTLLIYDCVM